MEHNLIIETGHFLPPACSLYLLVSDKYFNNFWIMVSWQICCMRPNMRADARLCDVDPMGCRAFFITHCPLWLPAMSNHSASDGKGNSWRQDCVKTTYTIGSVLPNLPTLSWKALIPLLPPDLLLYALH